VSFAVLDTNVYIDHWEHGAHSDDLARVRQSLIVRHSAVVLSELRRGAHSAKARRMVESLRRIAGVVWTPTSVDWWRAGEIVAKIGNRHGWQAAKKRDFQNDALIALTARHHGAVVVTSNVDDFELLAREVSLRLWRLPARS
jgi:predicted nucleic acid-binding protein